MKEQKIIYYKDELNDEFSGPKITPIKIDENYKYYSRLYFEFFGKKAFIANPGGSKEQTIDAIKKSLIEQKDLLDEILNSNEQNIYY